MGRTGYQARGCGLALWALLLWPSLGLAAEDTPPVPLVFMSQEIKPAVRMFVVSQDGNLRATPSLRGEKLGEVVQGQRLSSPGSVRADGGIWYAVRHKGKDLGFVFQTLVMPVLDGSLSSPLTGDLAVKDAACFYELIYSGRTSVEEAPLQTADYDLTLYCTRADKRIRTRGFMFLTESPYNLSQDPLFQISLDVLEIGGDEEPPSVALIWNRDDDRITFDSMTPELYAGKPDPLSLPAEDLPQALVAAMKLAIGAWNGKVWPLLPAAEKP
ncbi:hypothetical protein JCM17960_18220 [Magnetospira thiophila]